MHNFFVMEWTLYSAFNLSGSECRSRIAGPVKDLVVSDVHGKKIIFVLHSGGTLRIWDLHCRSKLFSQSWSDQGRFYIPCFDRSVFMIIYYHFFLYVIEFVGL